MDAVVGVLAHADVRGLGEEEAMAVLAQVARMVLGGPIAAVHVPCLAVGAEHGLEPQLARGGRVIAFAALDGPCLGFG